MLTPVACALTCATEMPAHTEMPAPSPAFATALDSPGFVAVYAVNAHVPSMLVAPTTSVAGLCLTHAMFAFVPPALCSAVGFAVGVCASVADFKSCIGALRVSFSTHILARWRRRQDGYLKTSPHSALLVSTAAPPVEDGSKPTRSVSGPVVAEGGATAF